MKIIILCLVLLFSPFSPALSQQDFSQQHLVEQLQKPQNLQGHFIQQRFLKSLDNPIVTKGQFILLKNKGLLWQMETPFANRLRVRQDGISQWNGTQWVSGQKPGQAQQVQLFLGLLSGDISALTKQFDPMLSGSAENWQLTLKPNSLLIKQIFSDIHIRGGQLITQIELNETQGDKTVIQLEQIRIDQPLPAFAQSALE